MVTPCREDLQTEHRLCCYIVFTPATCAR